MTDWISCTNQIGNPLNLEIFIGTGKFPFKRWDERIEKHFYKTTVYKLLLRFRTPSPSPSNDVSVDFKLIDNKNKILTNTFFRVYDKEIETSGGITNYSFKFRLKTFSFENSTMRKMNHFKFLLLLIANDEKYFIVSPPFYIFAKKGKSSITEKKESPTLDDSDISNSAIKNIVEKSISASIDEFLSDEMFDENVDDKIEVNADILYPILYPIISLPKPEPKPKYHQKEEFESYFAINDYDKLYDIHLIKQNGHSILNDNIFGRFSDNNGTLLFD
jgi:hypothetical protein